MPIPASPDLILSAFANAGTKTAPPQTDPSGFVNFTDGYTPDYEIDLNSGVSSAKAVERPIQNYMFNLLTALGQYWQLMGAPPWYSTMPSGYNQGAVVGRVATGGQWRLWRSLVNANVVDPNLTAQTSWEYVPLNTELLTQVALPAGGVAEISPGGQTAELVLAATDFNTLQIGTWEYATDAIANGSPNSPTSGGTSYAGMLEAKRWVSGGTTYYVQRYLDRTGTLYVRGATNGVWTAWSSGTVPVSNFSVDTGTTNAIQGNATLASGIISDNQLFWVKVAHANTGPTTFSPNTTVTAAALLGQNYLPLQGGELVADSRILVGYRTSTSNYFLAFNSGGAVPVIPASNGNQAVNLSQLSAAIGTCLPSGGTAVAAIKLATDRNIAMSGDVIWTVSFDGSADATAAGAIAAGAVTLAKMANLTGNTLLGNPTGSSAAPSAITLANGLQFSGGTLGMGAITPSSVNAASGAFAGPVSGGSNCPGGATVNNGYGMSGIYSQEALAVGSGGCLGFGYTVGVPFAYIRGTIESAAGSNAGGIVIGTKPSTSSPLIQPALSIAGSGAATFASSVTCTTMNATSSDRRLKRNIRKFKARPLHRSVPLVSYTMKTNGWHGLGSIAQKVQKVAPEHVGEFEQDGKKYLSLNYAGLAYEQSIWASQEVDRLTAKIEKLERKLARASIHPRKRGFLRLLLEAIW